MKYLKLFEQASDYEAYKNGSEFVLPNVSYIEKSKNVAFNPNKYDYLTIEALEDDFSVSVFPNTYEYRIGTKGEWKTLNAYEYTDSVNSGEIIQFRGKTFENGTYPNVYTETAGVADFKIMNDKQFNLKGTVMSMLYGLVDDHKSCVDLTESGFVENVFDSMFKDCVGLKSVSSDFLPATTLAVSCYANMFSGCSSLTKTPKLPAMKLMGQCYYYMFEGCTSLVKAPELPAINLAGYCYNGMFTECSSLAVAPKLNARDLTDAYGCYQGMFQDCTSLVKAPELPATILERSCYSSMFYGCTNLTSAPNLPATVIEGFCYSNMFTNCTSLTAAPELPAMHVLDACYQGMFEGCTSLVKAPELPAITWEDDQWGGFSGYDRMFMNCSNLNYIKIHLQNFNRKIYLFANGVSTNGTFIKSETSTLPVGENGIPEGWTVINI